MAWADLSDVANAANPSAGSGEALSRLNDDGTPFTEIASLIEQYL